MKRVLRQTKNGRYLIELYIVDRTGVEKLVSTIEVESYGLAVEALRVIGE